ncbi:glycosyltransferase [Candidatus Beckwithbacteria bacterium CG10_big_fil_rev_8_21_14_0_10_34_10]|uniref:Glycosyltransferase n=1 Tax=Candidatus Beckwithbacteria bacterium CG10_big_fil_rev_8_21_14_0_10_34_10 TaxID=1974495 RepID=A0A2H0W8T8_9BACT|nr:MAG: glycosyltransferase [Candidatus Beckwithbacteria bacterium CG10_big_fil_rev_8_21_14_0_10_34_10]
MTKIYKKSISYRTFNILGIKVDFINLPQALSQVEAWIDNNKQYQITTPNPEHIVMSLDDYRFKEILNKSALRICDGVGLSWAAKFLSRKISRISNKADKDSCYIKTEFDNCLSGVDLMQALCAKAAKKKWRVFLLGGKNDVVQKAAFQLKKNSKDLKVEYDSGSLNIENESPKELRKTIEKINKFKPQLLFVAFGAPIQEKWIYNNLKKLKVKVAMGVGGSFDYLAGKVKRAPKVIRNHSLEWLWRLIIEPWRFKRQLRLLKFVYLVIKEGKHS